MLHWVPTMVTCFCLAAGRRTEQPLNAADNANAGTGTDWSYGLNLDSRTGTAGGSTDLYALNGTNIQDSILSTASSGSWRANQEVYVDTTSGTAVDTGIDGTWTVVDNTSITFVVNLANTGLQAAILDGTIAFHWAMSCANDVIEGYKVPAPGILLLMAMGLFGIGASSAVRKRKLA